MKVDDPVGCIGVHWGSGLWGMIATGLFGMDGGVFRGGDGTMLGYNLVACIVVTLWSFGFTAIIVSPFFHTLFFVRNQGIGRNRMFLIWIHIFSRFYPTLHPQI